MKAYVVKVREILVDTVLVEAESAEEARDKAAEYNNTVGFDLDCIEDYKFHTLREATDEDKEYYEVLEVE